MCRVARQAAWSLASRGLGTPGRRTHRGPVYPWGRVQAPRLIPGGVRSNCVSVLADFSVVSMDYRDRITIEPGKRGGKP